MTDETPGSWEATTLATYVTLSQASQAASTALLTALALLEDEASLESLDTLADVIAGMLFHAEAKGRATGLASEPVDGFVALPALPSRPYSPPKDDWREPETKPLQVPELDEDHLDDIKARIVKALETIYTDQGDHDQVDVDQDNDNRNDRVIRLVENETAQAMQYGLQAGMVEAGKATGYRRGVNPDCCRFCFYTWKEGYVYPIGQKMWRHSGCRCVPIPTTDQFSENDEELFDTLMQRYYSNTIEKTAYNHRPRRNEAA